MELIKLQNKTDKIYYNNLIKYLNKNKINDKFIENKLNYIQKSITSISDSEKTKETHETKEEEIKYSDDYLYKKPWTRLSEIHKIIKMKEFVSKLLIENIENKDYLEKKLINLIKKKKITKKDKINYDKINGQIISIPDLSYNKKLYEINL
jgi:hypothetical protein